MDTVEIIGLIASCIVLISFLMRRMWAVRVISIVACIFFVIYGLMLDSWVLWGLNGALILIHLCFLLFGKRKKGDNRLGKFNKTAFSANSLRKENWFLSAKGDDYIYWN